MTAREADIFRCLVDTVVAPSVPVARAERTRSSPTGWPTPRR